MKKTLIGLNIANYLLLIFLMLFPYDPYSWFNGFVRIGIFIATSLCILIYGLWMYHSNKQEYEYIVSISSIINAINLFVLPIVYMIFSIML